LACSWACFPSVGRNGGLVGAELRHTTDNNRIGLVLRGLSTVAVASVITLVMLPEAASDVRPEGAFAAAPAHRTVVGHGHPIKRVRFAAETDLWADPAATNVPVGRLTVRAIDLDVAFRLGAHDEVIERGPGLWPGTPLPGDAGNAVFAGHRTTFTHPFEDLDQLHKGDVIRTRVRGGSKTTFKVYKTMIVREARYGRVALRQPAKPRARLVTLFACTPKGFRTHRIVVKAIAARIPRAAKHKHTGDDLDVRVIERS
jgi:LPXTG-site transpeptidase (sortase) family protein